MQCCPSHTAEWRRCHPLLPQSSNATFIAHEASRDARDIAAACDMLVTSSAPLSRSWLSDAGAAERRDQEAQRMAKATGGSYAFLGTLLR